MSNHLVRFANKIFARSRRRKVFLIMRDNSDFRWLSGYEPERAMHRAQTRLEITAPARAAWHQLVAVKSWPDRFKMSKDVILPDGKVRQEDGMSFEWAIQGVRFKSTIYQFEPFRRLCRRSSNPLISTCHIWALEERNGSTMVITDETQRGLLPTLLGFLVRPKLRKGQEVWLDSLAAHTFASSALPESFGGFRMEANNDAAA
jgi:hypothetical protein